MDIKRYYSALETRVGNWLLFGGRAHLGYYPRDTWWPFPIDQSLLAMEDQMAQSLRLAPGSCVLDAGCGDGQVALHLADQGGLRVHAIDVLPQQVQRARQNVAAATSRGHAIARSKPKAEAAVGAVTVHTDDYHHLTTVTANSMDGIYTIETLVHASDLPTVLGELYRVLKPGGRIALYEYDHWRDQGAASVDGAGDESPAMDDKVRRYGALASASSPVTGREAGSGGWDGLAQAVAQAGFVDVQERDISAHIRPLLRWLVFFLSLPCLIVVALGVESYFINTCAVVVNYRRGWKYVAVTAQKPEGQSPR
ncbi:S-adenosyl-L-methionine-dependent methyltransferase [Aspergillus campestris IBT 28561]|uniref:S-adenosyl-L-methionine-dependent methyltransferase n=1 Tax=Aspergillus campestris (strain IBT 28561) TaxID=1392248 RepID=A0A2I1D4F6_ASPC2|nr:S-adenosyl-L-methionine-dependent methyltransferase [Aspergillus campestris IBT 28561]PKY04767.1 S-adenosyl-L-methionine-dependent methyltransferase [Aspergillus campestris IBT 28561]